MVGSDADTNMPICVLGLLCG